MTSYQSINEIQAKLKSSIVQSVNTELRKHCTKVVQEYLMERVYKAYIPQGEHAYDRTMELFNAVTVGEITVGTKFVTFEVYIDSEKIQPHVTDSKQDWNQHASVDPIEVNEYIPMWIEEGTEGSLWDREGTHYMEQAYLKLDQGGLAMALARSLKSMGWNVITL
ncbi:hypothetical protein V7094_15485 [Priestia megaterium]|uniref:hypothetical protein n=1 Tax=Priestia megaterium TaxID=1404 RepID=UPI00300055CD